MSRPQKCRKVCAMPQTVSFVPSECQSHGIEVNKTFPNDKKASPDKTVEMSLDEYETIRLIDLFGCTQEECAIQMEVARTTVQSVYTSARQKLADVIINGKRLEIRGGNYELCPHANTCCGQNQPARPCERRHCEKFNPID